MDDFRTYLPLTKVDEDQRMVWGYASTPTLDFDNEVVKVSAIEKALPDYMQWANIREMHQASAVGSAVHANTDQKGLWLGAYIADDQAWRKCKSTKLADGTVVPPVYKGFSIGGKVVRKVGNAIEGIILAEISLVDRPANPDCRIEIVKLQKDDKGADVLVMGTEARLPLSSELMKFGFPGMGGEESITITKSQAGLFGKLLGMLGLVKGDVPSPTNEGGVIPPASLSAGHHVTDSTGKRQFTAEQRQHAASIGHAMPDGSFPINDNEDLRNAIHDVGRASDQEKARSHVIARARALGSTDLLPAGWSGVDKSVEVGDFDDVLKSFRKTEFEAALLDFDDLLKSFDYDDMHMAEQGLSGMQHHSDVEADQENGDPADQEFAFDAGSLEAHLAGLVNRTAAHERMESGTVATFPGD